MVFLLFSVCSVQLSVCSRAVAPQLIVGRAKERRSYTGIAKFFSFAGKQLPIDPTKLFKFSVISFQLSVKTSSPLCCTLTTAH
jgi:hypothetical protein